MKKFVFLLVFLAAGLLVAAQNQTPDEPQAQPEFKGYPYRFIADNESSTQAINEYLCKQICYPLKSINCNREGIEVIQFVVNTNGQLSDFKVINSVCPAIDEAMITALQTTNGMWNPAYENGKAVANTTEIYRVFKIDDELTAEEIHKEFTAKATDYFNRANKQLLEKNNPARAKKLYSMGLNYLPFDESLLLGRGLCCYELGDVQSANSDWKRMKELAQKNQTIINVEEIASNYTDLEGYKELKQVLKR